MTNRADIYNSFPDSLKEVIKGYEPYETKTPQQIHDIMLEIRHDLDLAPWHPFTQFMKLLAKGCTQSGERGEHLLSNNSWYARRNMPEMYTTKKARWADLNIHTVRDGVEGVLHAAVCPKLRKLWIYTTESEVCVPIITFRSDAGVTTRFQLSRSWVFEAAERVIQKNYPGHPTVGVRYLVGSSEMSHRAGHRNRTTKPARIQPAPQPVETIKKAEPAKQTHAQTPTYIKTLDPRDSEVVLTLLEFAGIKLKELGMFAAFHRYCATVKRLTEGTNNETEETETGTHDYLSGDVQDQ